MTPKPPRPSPSARRAWSLPAALRARDHLDGGPPDRMGVGKCLDWADSSPCGCGRLRSSVHLQHSALLGMRAALAASSRLCGPRQRYCTNRQRAWWETRVLWRRNRAAAAPRQQSLIYEKRTANTNVIVIAMPECPCNEQARIIPPVRVDT